MRCDLAVDPARDVVRHLLEWFPGFLEGGSEVRLAPVPLGDGDLLTSWEARSAEVQELLESRPDVTYSSRMLGEMRAARTVSSRRGAGPCSVTSP